MKICEVFIGSLITVIAQLYIWFRLSNKKIGDLSSKVYLFLVLLAIVMTINYLYINKFFRIIIIVGCMILFVYKVLKRPIKNSIIMVLYSELLAVISEVIFISAISYIGNYDINSLEKYSFGKLLTNVVIAVLSIIIFNIVDKIKFLQDKVSIISNYPKRKLILISILYIFIVNFFIMQSYYKITLGFLLILNAFNIVIFTFIIIQIMNEYSNNVAIKNKYDILMSKSIDYENIIDSQRMENHENKNDLYVLKTMIPSSNKEAHEQLDLMINEYENREIEYQQNKDLYQKTLRIPSGGLRGLFYQKLLYIENNNIEYSLRVSKNINKDSLNDLDKYERRNLCKIIGVYLDNAIQEVEKIDNKKIRIDLKLDKKVFQISISNSLGKILEIEKINDKGYSTKGKKHGYGLSLVNDILKESKKITSETSITGSIFKQTVKIKI